MGGGTEDGRTDGRTVEGESEDGHGTVDGKTENDVRTKDGQKVNEVGTGMKGSTSFHLLDLSPKSFV